VHQFNGVRWSRCGVDSGFCPANSNIYESCGRIFCLICDTVTAHPGSAGEQPALTPRKLTLMNTTTQSVIQDLSFPSSVLAVRVNRKRLQPTLIEMLVHYCLILACIAVMARGAHDDSWPPG